VDLGSQSKTTGGGLLPLFFSHEEELSVDLTSEPYGHLCRLSEGTTDKYTRATT
jgi:hypothetical protein